MTSLFKLVTATSLENPDIGDLEMSGGQFVPCADNTDMMVQRIKCRLLWWQGEWYQDQRQGTPWSAIMGKGISDAKVRQTLRQLIESVPGVATVPSIEVTHAGEAATLTVEIQADAGYTVTVEDLALPYGVI